MGFPGGATASCLSTYAMNGLDRFYLNAEKGFAEMQPSTGYGPIMGHTHKGQLTQPITVHQAVQMDEMAGIIFEGKQPEVLAHSPQILNWTVVESRRVAEASGRTLSLGMASRDAGGIVTTRGTQQAQVQERPHVPSELVDIDADGGEMEALVGASISALTVYDMCKAMSHDIVIKETKLIAKTGGKRDFKRA